MDHRFSGQTTAETFPHTDWQYRYWWWAAVPMLLMFVLEALQISLFKTAQAPNVNNIMQMILMLGFFAAWMVVPRVIWLQLNRLSIDVGWKALAIRLGLVGLGLSILHLLLLAALLRFMYSAPNWGVIELMQSFGEVWLAYAGLWLLVYCLACAAVIAFRKRQEASQDEVKPVARLAVRHAGKTLFLPPDEIIWIEADGNYAKIYHNQKVYLLRQSLRLLEQELPEALFIRTHRQALVNLRQIKSLHSHSGGQSYLLQLNNNLQAPLSRRHLAAIKQHLQ